MTRNLDHPRILAARLFATGLLLANSGSALATVHYVDITSTNATPPYTNWATAATNGDGLNNWQEWRCGTNPTNALSALRLLAPVTDGTNVTVSWQSVAGVNYFLERSTDLSASPPFTLLAARIPGRSPTLIFTDTNAVGSGPFFYRVGVSGL